jgi:hypothetical protein
MPPTESGIYRVLPGSPGTEGTVFLERWSEDPITVRAEGNDEPLASAVDGLLPGNLVEATVEWQPEGSPVLAALSVRRRSLFEFVGAADHVFEAAEDTFAEGRREHAPIASTVTYDTDRNANGVLYTIAEQGGGTDVFAEFREGQRTLEPMVEKLGEGGAEPPHEVFVVRPVEEPFVVVYLAIEKEGLLADTVRDEFDIPRA